MFLHSKKNKIIAGLSVLAIIGAIFIGSQSLGQYFSDAKADGINPVITPDTKNVSTAGSTVITFTTSGSLAAGAKIRLGYNSSYTGTLTTANLTVNTVAPSTVTNATASGVTTSTITIAGATIASGATVTISTTGLTSPSTAGNYSFTIDTDASDAGAVLQYVGQYNVVNVRAFVPVFLSFNIRNTADTADTNVCDLGTATVTAVNTCSYRLKVATNATNGYSITAVASGDLTNGTYSMTNAAAGPTGTTPTAGTESYGVFITPGTITGSGGTISAVAPYATTAGKIVNYSQTTAATILTATKPNFPSASGDTTRTSLITHSLAIQNSTPAGYYTQTITYKVAPSF